MSWTPARWCCGFLWYQDSGVPSTTSKMLFSLAVRICCNLTPYLQRLEGLTSNFTIKSILLYQWRQFSVESLKYSVHEGFKLAGAFYFLWPWEYPLMSHCGDTFLFFKQSLWILSLKKLDRKFILHILHIVLIDFARHVTIKYWICMTSG
jgi:hypothetical protein